MVTGAYSVTKQYKARLALLQALLLMAFCCLSGKVAAQLPGWTYLAPVRINNAATVKTYNFQQLLSIDTKSLIAAGQLKADGSDLRFGKELNGATLLPYYIESGINTTDTKVWVKIDVVPPKTTVTFYMFYGNTSAPAGSTLNTFYGPYSTTDSTTSNNVGSTTSKVHRGFSFTPLKNMLVARLGKRIPGATTNTVTLYDYVTQQALEQVKVGGAAGGYNYTALNKIRWLTAGKSYVLDVFIEGGSYYQDVPTHMNKYISFSQLQYCNSCAVDEFPGLTLGLFNSGYADMHFYLRNDTITQPSYVVGPFLTITPDTLKNAVFQQPYKETLVATNGSAPYTFELVSGSLPSGFTFSSAGVIEGTGSVPGTYPISIKVTDSYSINGNPTTIIKTFNFVVEKRGQTVTFGAIADHTYGDAAFAVSATSTSGLPVTISVASGPATIAAGNMVTLTGAGTVTLLASQAGSSDYEPGEANATFSVAARALTINVDNKSREYGVANPTFTVSYNGLMPGDVVPNLTLQTTAELSSDIGTYPITAHTDPSSNYIIKINNGELTINKKNVTVSLNATPAITRQYDGTNVASLVKANYTVTGLVNGDTLLVKGSAVYNDKNAGTAKTVTVTGFTGEGINSSKYTIATTSASTQGVITRKAVALTINPTSLITKEYDATNAAMLTAANYQLTGVVATDDVAVSCTGTYNNSSVGKNKAITITGFALSGADKENYTMTGGSIGSFTGEITTRAIQAVLLASPAVAKVYDGNDVATLAPANYSITGVIGSEQVSINTPTTGKYEDAHAGTNKKVTVSGIVLSGTASANYVLSPAVATGNIGTIAKTGVAVVADTTGKAYGAADGVLTYKATGLLGSDALSGALAREEGENVGSYKISQGVLTSTDYFIASFTPSVFVITPALVQVIANDKERTQGQINPELTYYCKGFVRGEDSLVLTSPVTLQTTAAATSAVGEYDIVPSGAAAANYTFEFVNGKLTVLPAAGKVRVWTSSRNTMQVRIYADAAQKVSIVMYTESGQRVFYRQEQLVAGMNVFPYPVGQLPSAFYVVNIQGNGFMEAHKINIR